MGIEHGSVMPVRAGIVFVAAWFLLSAEEAVGASASPADSSGMRSAAAARPSDTAISVNRDTAAAAMHTPLDTADTSYLPPMEVRKKRLAVSDRAARPTVVEGDLIRRGSRATPLEELSQSSAGVYVSSRGTGLHGVSSGASGGIYIRGLGGSPNSQVLVVEDGVPDYQGIFGHPIPDAFFPSLIDRVTIVKGGDGVLYGTNAMGGVVIIENRWPDSAGIRVENDAAYGSFNTFRERATLLHNGKNKETVGAFSALNTDGHRDGAEGNSAAGQIGLRLHPSEATTLAFREKIIRLDGGDPGPSVHPFADHRFNVIRNNFSMRADHSGRFLLIRSTAWLNAGEHRLYDGFFSRDYTAGATAEGAASLLNDKVDCLIGGSGEYIDGKVIDRIEKIESPVEKLPGGSVYGQLTVKPGFGLDGVVGGRLHYSEKYGTVPLYKAGFQYAPADWLSLHARLTKNFRQPTLRELYLPFPVANPGLKPETAYNGESGAELKIGPVRLLCTVFATRAFDLIKYFGMSPSAEVVNIDRADINGIEGELAIDPAGPFSVFFTACRQDVGRYTKQNPEAKANGRISYGGDCAGGHLEVAVTGEYVHGLYMNNYRRDRIPDLFFIDGSVRLRTRVRNSVAMEPYCMVRNIGNAIFEYIRWYRMPDINFLAGLLLEI